jgi:hypothetical protein
LAAGSDGSAAQSDGLAAGSDESVARSDGSAAQSDGLAAGSDGSAAESDGSAAKSDGLAVESDGLVARSDGLAVESDGSVARSDGSEAESDGSAARSDELVLLEKTCDRLLYDVVGSWPRVPPIGKSLENIHPPTFTLQILDQRYNPHYAPSAALRDELAHEVFRITVISFIAARWGTLGSCRFFFSVYAKSPMHSPSYRSKRRILRAGRRSSVVEMRSRPSSTEKSYQW